MTKKAQAKEVAAQQEVAAQPQQLAPQISLLKLTTGEVLITEIVVDFTTNGQEIVTLVNPCVVSEEILEDGRVNVAFYPIATLAKRGAFQIATSHIVLSGEPDDGFAQAYIERFAPKDDTPQLIVPPEKKLVVPV